MPKNPCWRPWKPGKPKAVGGWFEGDRPWLDSAEEIGALAAGMMGAAPDQVIHSATTTVNIHALVASLYRPEGRRVKILADELNFPTDIYALKGQLEMKGRDWRKDLVLAPSTDGRTLDEEAIAALFTEEVALAWLPSVLYRSGQILDMAYLTEQGTRQGRGDRIRLLPFRGHRSPRTGQLGSGFRRLVRLQVPQLRTRRIGFPLREPPAFRQGTGPDRLVRQPPRNDVRHVSGFRSRDRRGQVADILTRASWAPRPCAVRWR